MKKLLSAVLMIALLGCVAVAEPEIEILAPVSARAVFTFQGNPTTGYEWTCSVKNAGVAQLAQTDYAQAPNDKTAVGAGGTYRFELEALAPGEAVVEFLYARAWADDVAERHVYLIAVLEDGAMSVRPLDGIAPITGKVTGLQDGGALVTTKENGDVLCLFPESMNLPVQDETVIVWFNGAMTASIPGQINVLAWETVPGENAR